MTKWSSTKWNNFHRLGTLINSAIESTHINYVRIIAGMLKRCYKLHGVYLLLDVWKVINLILRFFAELKGNHALNFCPLKQTCH